MEIAHAMTSTLRELAMLFLRLGATAFGGPAAHIALMEREFVSGRQWLSHQEFLDLMSAANLIPGPNSTELAIHIGQARAGKIGGIVAGVCFILPAALLVLGFAILYRNFGTLPQTRWILSGVQPVVVAIVVNALWKLARSAIKNVFSLVLALLVVLAATLGINEIALIFLAALIGLMRSFSRGEKLSLRSLSRRTINSNEEDSAEKNKPDRLPLLIVTGVLLPPSVLSLFWIFLKIGSVIYGSGYVLLAFLHADLVEKLKWITDRQLLDAVAVGQLTPGPLFTSATFIGFLVHGYPGAIAATVGIFLPAFLFSGISFSALARMKSSPAARSFLDAVNAASLALMFVVTLQLARAALHDAGFGLSAGLFLVSLLLLWRTRCNSLWLIVGGALCGLLQHLL
jgi:chromate transporter